MSELLTRQEFKASVFERDKNKCVICSEPGQDAHHILERRLWPDGGYYIENGVTVCGKCHLEAEQTLLSCEELRDAVGVKTVLPPHLYRDVRYDKWGNPSLSEELPGHKCRGELMDDESVKKVMAHVPVAPYVKYPRTYHLPWSPGATDDDRILVDLTGLEQERVVVTEKRDGENTSLYRDHIHARSLDSGSHPSRDRVKALWSSFAHEIPEGWRLCGENLYAKHSIHYKDLRGYLEIFSVWNDLTCLSWDETIEWCQLLDLPIVPVLYIGPWDEKVVNGVFKEGMEGYVVRPTRSFHYREFRTVVGKYVRANHVQTHGNWMRQQIVPNELEKP